jgi:hypothetical protein
MSILLPYSFTYSQQYDINFTMQNVIILASLIVHSENNRKDELIKRFYDLYR